MQEKKGIPVLKIFGQRIVRPTTQPCLHIDLAGSWITCRKDYIKYVCILYLFKYIMVIPQYPLFHFIDKNIRPYIRQEQTQPQSNLLNTYRSI